jgi:hypothetical protein
MAIWPPFFVGEIVPPPDVGSVRNAGDGLPDFIFGRRRDIEQAYGFVLAGVLVTDIPKGRKPSEDDSGLISLITRSLVDEARLDPNLQEVGVWRGGVKPADGLSPPFPDALMQARMQRCNVIEVRVDPRARPLQGLDT